MDVFEQLQSQILPPAKLRSDGVPSASLAILENGAIQTHVISNGLENADTIYQCGSISKAITALGLARLVDQGRLSYDTKIADHLQPQVVEEFLDHQTAHLLQHVTIRMLITHTSGLAQPYDSGHPKSVEKLPSAEQSVCGDAATNTVRMRFASVPGAQLLYCSGAFTLLQLAMEDVCAKPFAELMQELVMRPLGMSRTFYGDLPVEETNFTKPHLTGYQPTPTGVHRFTELAAVGLWSTPTDLLKTVSATQQSLHVDDGFLKPATAREVLIDGAVTFRSGAARHRCGLGWYSTKTVFAHRGANPGYHSYVFGFFDQSPSELHNTGFSVMTNSLMGLETIRPLVNAIMYLKRWPRQRLMPSSLGLDDYVPYAAEDGAEVDPAWKAWGGKWEDDWSLLESAGQPMLQFRELEPVKLLPAAVACQSFASGDREIMLVADGLVGTAVRLTWSDNERVVELLQLGNHMLKRTS